MSDETVKPTSVDLNTILDDLATKRDDVARQITQAEAFETENLLSVGDEALEANDQKLIRLRRQAARLEKMEEATREQLATVEAEEAEAARAVKYDAARILIDEADEALRKTYAKHAAALAAVLRRRIEIRQIVEAVNGDRPKGAALLDLDAIRKPPPHDNSTRFTEEIYYVDAEGDQRRAGVNMPIKEIDGRFYVFHDEYRREEVFKKTRRLPVPLQPQYAPPWLEESVVLPTATYDGQAFWPERN